jgi:FdhD protein
MKGPLVDETIVRMNVNGVSAHAWRCTPMDLEALAIGRLFIDGVIAAADEAHLIVSGSGTSEVTIEARIEARATITAAPRGQLPIPDAEIFTEMFRLLFNTVDARHAHGGMHAAAATDGRRIIVQMEDVGRHNTIDKITGALLLARLSPAAHGLLTSSRVSGEIADKSARAGFAWLASRSLPTTLAVSFAHAAHMPIIGRAAGRNAFVYQ